MQNTFRVNGTMSRENGILMGECPVCKLGWFGIVVAGRQKTISVGRENYLVLPSYCQYIAVRIRKERKKIPEQVVKRATALTLQQQLQSVLLSGKRKTVYMGKKAMFFLYHDGVTSFSEFEYVSLRNQCFKKMKPCTTYVYQYVEIRYQLKLQLLLLKDFDHVVTTLFS